MPAEAGIQNYLKTLDSRLRGNDVKGRFKTFYETIKLYGSPRIDGKLLSVNHAKISEPYRGFVPVQMFGFLYALNPFLLPPHVCKNRAKSNCYNTVHKY
jgi:hypothetical protein